MWGSILKIFKSPSFRSPSPGDQPDPQPAEAMDPNRPSATDPRDEPSDVNELVPMELYSGTKSKQRASILWLICKANNNKVPDDLKDPYYRDHDEQDQIKPLVVHALASAEYYCLALGNIYADPNYHNLNHWGVIQALARKGVYVAEPSDVALTETVLIQTSPLRLSAHMAVIEAIMALFLKETVTVERIVNSVRRFVPHGGPIELPTDIEEALVFWINKVCVKMKHRIEDEMNIATPEVQKENESGGTVDTGSVTPRRPTSFRSKERGGDNLITTPSRVGDATTKKDVEDANKDSTAEEIAEKSGNLIDKVAPPIPLLQDLGDLSDGCCLASLISYYCPTSLRWHEICLSDPMSMADSLYNLQLVQKFCRDHLPFDPCFLTLEDMVYQHSSVRQNILVFLAELFFLFEVRPAKCVKISGPRPDLTSPEIPAAGAVRRNGNGLVSGATKRSFQNPVSPIPDLRNSTYSYSSFTSDNNRISPKCGSAPPHREPLLPRRQSSQHERMHERNKRYSVTDGTKMGGATSPTAAMRRTHSMQDIDKNGAERPYAEVSSGIELRNTEGDANYYSTTSIGHPFYHPRRGRGKDEEISDDTSELYLRPLTTSGGYTDEPLMPAIIRPSKEKNNRDSKPDELGDHNQHGHRSSVNNQRPLRGGSITPQPVAAGGHHKRSPPLSDDHRNNGRPSTSPQRRSQHGTDLPDKPAVPAKPEYLMDLQHKMDSGFYLGAPHHSGNVKGEPDIHQYDYLDNRELEEQLNGGGGGGGGIYAKPKAMRLSSGKQPFVLNSDDGVRLKDGLESLGSSESGVFFDQRDLLSRKSGGGAGLTNGNNFQGTTSFAQLSKLRDGQIGGINIVYMQHERGNDSSGSSEGGSGGGSGGNRNQPLKSSFLQKGDRGDKRTSFAALPNQTTWQQHTSNKRNPSQGDSGHETPCSSDAVTPETGGPLAAQLCDVRLKLEDKRRRIESDKRKMELMMGRMRQRMGKQAFLQAVSKNRGGTSSGRGTPDSGAGDEVDHQNRYVADNVSGDTNGSHHSGEAAAGNRSGGRHTPSPPGLEDSMNYEDYSQSIDQLGSSLCDLQSDLQRLTVEQEQIQQLMHNGADRTEEEIESEPAASQFFLHDRGNGASTSGSTKTWGALAAQQAQASPARSDSLQGEPGYASVQRCPSREQVYQPIQRSASREQLYNQQQQQQQRSTSREQLYQPIQRSVSREQLYQPLQRSASREQLYQPMQRSVSREQLYQPMQRSVSREDLYQPMSLQRSASREQLYQPMQRSASREQLYQPMQRSASREQLYQPMQRSASREQLYQPMSLQRSPSHEQLYQPQPVHHIAQSGPPNSWGHSLMSEVGPAHRQVPVGAVMPQQQQQHAYVDQSGYLLHQQPPQGGYVMQQPQYIPMGMHSGGMPVYHPHSHPHQLQHHPNGPAPGDPYSHYEQYIPQQQQQGMMDPQGGYGGYSHQHPHQQMQQSPYRLHIEVPGGMGAPMHGMMQVGPSSRSQSPLTYHHQMQQQPQSHSRPPSRPPSAAGLPGVIGPSGLPAKATPVAAPPESYMEPQSVHFIDASAVAASLEDTVAADLADMEEDAFTPLSAGADFSARALSSLEHVTSGTATYRVRSGEPTSPTRPVLGKTFRVPKSKVLSPPLRDPPVASSPLTSPTVEQPPGGFRGATPLDKGFFVSFDDEQLQQPKRPKPPLRTRKVPKGAGDRSPQAGTPERETAPEVPEKTPLAYQTVTRVSPPRGQPPTPQFSSTFNRTPVPYSQDHDGSFSDEVAQYALNDSSGNLPSPTGAQVVSPGVGFIIGTELVSPDPMTEDDMARRKEKILMSVIKRKEQQEAIRAKKELEAAKRREQERVKQEMLERKKEEERIRRQAIFEQYKQRKAAMDDLENDRGESAKNATLPKSKLKPMKPRPKSLHESALSAAEHRATDRMAASGGTRGSQTNLAGGSGEAGGYQPAGYRYVDTDSGLGRATPPRRAPSPGQGPSMRHPPSPTAYGGGAGLPPGLVSHRMGGLFSDTASDSCSTTSSTVEYTGPKLFKQPTAKSNRGIIVNAINTVLAGAVNNDFKKRAVEEISRSDSKHFLILFRDSGCQFRALYSYSPEKDEVFKLFGTGPKQVTEKMMDKFFKYNCGGRNFTEIQTKHLTVTIDAFTIHNTLWQGKRPTPSKKDYL